MLLFSFSEIFRTSTARFFLLNSFIFDLASVAMWPTIMKRVTLDWSFVWMLISDTRAMGRLDVVFVVSSLRVLLGWGHT